MLPNTLPLYSGNEVDQTQVRASVGNAVRVSDDAGRGEFRLVLGEGSRFNLVVQHSVQNGKGVGQVAIDRHTMRLSSTKVNEASGVEDTASASITITAPRRSFTNDELEGLFTGLMGILINPAATSDEFGMLEGFGANHIFGELLSGAV